jgi:hypothetical protein
MLWAAAANYRDLDQRHYLPAELYGRTILESADPNAILILSGDDSNGLVSYLQRVRGIRPDVTLVTSSFLNSEKATGTSWYDDALLRRNPHLKRPDYADLRARFPQAEAKQLATAAFINANAEGGRPILSEVVVSPELLRPELPLAPAGVFVKVLPPGGEPRIEERYWNFPIEPEQVKLQYRRVRGQDVSYGPTGLILRPVRYEQRLAALILRARFKLALARFDQKNFPEASRLCQSIINFEDEGAEDSPEIVHLLAISLYGSGQLDRAVPALRRSAEIGVRPDARAEALFYLSEIARKRGDEELSKRYLMQAMSVPGLDPRSLRQLQAQINRR